MIRERLLKVVLLLIGLLFTAAGYPVIDSLLHGSGPSDYGDDMMMSLYFALGIFLLIAVRNPAAHRSLIAFTAWSSFAHAAVMTTLGLQHASELTGFVGGSSALVVIGITLIVLTRRSSGEPASAVAVEEPAPGK